MIGYQQSFLSTTIQTDDLSHERPIIGLSGGINSMGVLCHLATQHPVEKRPRALLLYYAHLREHSRDTFRFVAAGVRYARQHFEHVEFGMHRASFLAWARQHKMIPHPTISPCSHDLKISQMEAWAAARGATVDLIGYIRKERRRIQRQQQYDMPIDKRYPIAHLSDDDCFALVQQEIGWYPAIYDLRDPNGKRIFHHNNCLPCKNMQLRDLDAVARYFPEYWQAAQATAEEIGAYWGRKTKYGADPCEVCTFD